jgi:DNA-binding transcriptional MerR regulator
LFRKNTKKMNNVKNVFSIKDLENLSGIKAHTIRIWEKRYDILKPMRTDTNIRLYDLQSLQKLLNITLLHDYGYKISKIATYSQEKIPSLVKEITSKNSVKNHAINSFKMAMMNFDQDLFLEVYDKLVQEKSFKEVFHEVFIPLMNELGMLWQTETINPAHEHFISFLIKQKLIANIEKLQFLKKSHPDTVFVLSLPMNEIHELGLMYLNYEILLHGYPTIYLGESMPVENLKNVNTSRGKKIIHITYFTVKPEREEVNDYVIEMNKQLKEDNIEIWILGRMTQYIIAENLSKQTLLFQSIEDLVLKLNSLSDAK